MLESVKQYLQVHHKSPFLVGERIEDWNREKLMRVIRQLHEVSPLLTLRSMRVSQAPVADPILSKIVGRPSSRKFLHYAGIHFFGSWNSALRACDIQTIRAPYNKFWTKSLIKDSIQKLRQQGHPLTVISMWRDRSIKTRNALKEVTGKATTGSALHDAARRNFGSWDRALAASGLDPTLIKEKPFWTKKKIVNSLKLLKESGVPLNSQGICSENGRYVAALIQKGAGKKRIGRSLHGGAHRIFGSWDRALIEAKIRPQVYRKRNFFWTPRQVGRVVNVLYHRKIPVNASSLARDYSDETKSIIFDFTGQKGHGHSLYKLGNKKFGSWDGTLKSAGFMLSEIRRTGSPCTREQEKLIDIIRMFHKNDIALNHRAMLRHSNELKYFVEHNFGPAVSGYSIVSTAKSLFGSWDQALWEAGLNTDEIRLCARPNISRLATLPHQVEDTKRDGQPGLVTYLGEPSKSPDEILESRENSKILDHALNSFDSDERELVERIFDAILQIHHYRDQDQLIRFIIEQMDHEVSADTVRSIFSQIAGTVAQTNS